MPRRCHRFESTRLQILQLLINRQNELCLSTGEITCGGTKQALESQNLDSMLALPLPRMAANLELRT